ncbi:MAG: sulfite exporter TauE/SafE family protein [Armatimonadetes bacterium]|nr:sulfite exporter TauE/SafE family protein [Armatimonadota bacterium]
MPSVITANDPIGWVILAVVGAIASGINAVAGGGSLISFPTIIALGVPDIAANATNSAALWPGSLSSAFGFAERLREAKRDLTLLLPPTIVGAIVGSFGLLLTPEKVFKIAVPILILFATILLAVQPKIKAWASQNTFRLGRTYGAIIQFFVAVYGGYFGAGMGILMLAYLGLLLDGDIHEQNALKAWLGVAINFVATAIFLWKGKVLLVPGAAMLVGSVMGGYGAARMSLRVDANKLRWGIVVFGMVMSVVFGSRVMAR